MPAWNDPAVLNAAVDNATALIKRARAAAAEWDAARETPYERPYSRQPYAGHAIKVDPNDDPSVPLYPEGMTAEEAIAADIEPLFYDVLYRQKRKKGAWRLVDAPLLPAGARLTDTHAHVHMLENPGFSLARAAVNGLEFITLITDPTEDGTQVFDLLDQWNIEAGLHIRQLAFGCCGHPLPDVASTRISVGCHPHNAKDYTPEIEAKLYRLLADPRVNAVGEIGLDYHYDLSPREVQRDVFRRQIRIAHETGLPVALHVREAHDEALAILREEGFPAAGTLLHCCSLSPEEVAPWIEAGCYIAYGGALTFNNGQDAREGAKLVPAEQLLVETDAPYMAPVPLRGVTCQPDFVSFTVDKMLEVRGCETRDQKVELMETLRTNAHALLDREPTAWQLAHAAGTAGAAGAAGEE